MSWWAEHPAIRAAAIFAVFVLIAFVFDRWMAARGRRLAGRVMRGGLTQQADTRLRFMRRLVWLMLLTFGALAALSQFEGLGKVAGSFLASGALVAAIVGFAARQTLANLVAGIMLTISQPLRVGDWVTFEEHYGVVEDVRLNFTVLRSLSEQRIVIPNERLASGILRNDTLESEAVGLDVSLWLPAGADVPRALDGAARGDRPDRDGRRDRGRGHAPGGGWRTRATARTRQARGRAARAVRSAAAHRGPARQLTARRGLTPFLHARGKSALPAKGRTGSTLESPPSAASA